MIKNVFIKFWNYLEKAAEMRAKNYSKFNGMY
jgi:hypothetical protein